MNIFPTRVLLATDGSEEAELALRAAADLARATGSELHIVHVLPTDVGIPYPAEVLQREPLQQTRQRARAFLDQQVERIGVERGGRNGVLPQGGTTGQRDSPVERGTGRRPDSHGQQGPGRRATGAYGQRLRLGRSPRPLPGHGRSRVKAVTLPALQASLPGADAKPRARAPDFRGARVRRASRRSAPCRPCPKMLRIDDFALYRVDGVR